MINIVSDSLLFYVLLVYINIASLSSTFSFIFVFNVAFVSVPVKFWSNFLPYNQYYVLLQNLLYNDIIFQLSFKKKITATPNISCVGISVTVSLELRARVENKRLYKSPLIAPFVNVHLLHHYIVYQLISYHVKNTTIKKFNFISIRLELNTYDY